MSARGAGLILALVFGGAPDAGAPRPGTSSPAECAKLWKRGFHLENNHRRVTLKAVRYAPPDGGVDPFGGTFSACRALGEGWFVAVGSFGPGFLDPLSSTQDEELLRTLERCPVTYTFVDRTCAPCARGNPHCPCADRYLPDWLFCEKPDPLTAPAPPPP